MRRTVFAALLALLSGMAHALDYDVAGPFTISNEFPFQTMVVGRFTPDRRPGIAMCYRGQYLKLFSTDANGRLQLLHEHLIWSPLAPASPGLPVAGSVDHCRMGVADLDGNGIDDVLLTHTRGAVVLRFAAGGLLDRQEFPTDGGYSGGFADGVFIDMDDDGQQDIVGLRGTGELVLHRNTGGGGMLQAVRLVDLPNATGFDGPAMAGGDLDSDGYPEVVIGLAGSQDEFNQTLVLRNVGGLGFSSPEVMHHPFGYAMDVPFIADLTDDGLPDLLLGNATNWPRSLFAIWAQGRDGKLLLPVAYAANHLPRGIFVGDLDGDARNDLAIAHGDFSSVTTYLIRPDRLLQFDKIYYGFPNLPRQRQNIAVADFDGNGCRDIYVITSHYSTMRGRGCQPLTVTDLRVRLQAGPQAAQVSFDNLGGQVARNVVARVELRLPGLDVGLVGLPPECRVESSTRRRLHLTCRLDRIEAASTRNLALQWRAKGAAGGPSPFEVRASVNANIDDPFPANDRARAGFSGFVRRLHPSGHKAPAACGKPPCAALVR